MSIPLKVNINRIIEVLMALLFFCLLSIVYSEYISSIYGYAGFSYDFSYEKTAISVMCLIFFYRIVGFDGVLSIYHRIVYALILIPSLVLYSLGGAEQYFLFFTLMCCLVVVVFSKVINVPSLRMLSVNEGFLFKILFFLIVAFLTSVFFQGGAAYLNFDFREVYSVRAQAASNLHPVYGYLSPAISKVVIPIFVVLSVMRKKWLYLFFGVFASLMLFALTSHKGPVFYPIVILAVYFISKKNIEFFILLGLIIVTMLSFLSFWVAENYGGTHMIGSLLIRRAIMIPVQLNQLYIDFFMIEPAYWWSNSKFSLGLSESPYEVKSANLIAEYYFGKPEMSSNAGWIASGFSQAGWFGALLYSALLGLLFSFLSSVGAYVGNRFVLSSSVILIMSILRSTDIITALLTHGLVFYILLLLFFPRKSVG